MKKTKYNAVFISDVHLGTRHCKAEELTKFLEQIKANTVMLVGDICDVWCLKERIYWPDSHSEVLRTLFKMAHKGTKVIYIPGNHDAVFRKYVGTQWGNIQIEEEWIHEAVNGKRYLILHGDRLDSVIQQHLWLAHIGSWLYDVLLAASTRVHQLRKAAGRVHWSLSAYLKRKVKSAVQYVDKYESKVVEEARKLEVGGVICGHIHHAEITEFEGVEYMNCGDWVESMTAIVEHVDGTFELKQWCE